MTQFLCQKDSMMKKRMCSAPAVHPYAFVCKKLSPGGRLRDDVCSGGLNIIISQGGVTRRVRESEFKKRLLPK